jgi:hypothetical protein
MTTRLQRASRRARGSWKARTTPRPTPWRCSTWRAGPAGACWGDLLKAVGGTDAQWRHEIDAQFCQALDETLFAPSPGRMNPGRMNSVHNRLYHPIIYSIERGPEVELSGGAQRRSDRRPKSVTIVLAPEPEAAHDAKRV